MPNGGTHQYRTNPPADTHARWTDADDLIIIANAAAHVADLLNRAPRELAGYRDLMLRTPAWADVDTDDGLTDAEREELATRHLTRHQGKQTP